LIFYARLLVSSADLVPGIAHSTAIAQERGVVIALMSHYTPIAYKNQLKIKFTEISSTDDSFNSEILGLIVSRQHQEAPRALEGIITLPSALYSSDFNLETKPEIKLL
jgi:hypothetical protein